MQLEQKGVRDVWITFESNPNLERASSQSFSLTSCQPQARIWKIVFVWPAAGLAVISLVESIMMWPIWSLANCVETGLLHKVQSPFFKKLMHGSLVAASPWAQTCTYVLWWTKVFFAVGNAESYDPHGQTRTCYPRISQGMAAAPYEF